MNFNKRLVIALSAGFVLGTFWLIAARFVTFKDTRVHYHANFVLYVNGERDRFENPTFYEETTACSAEEVGPKARVHLHDQKPEAVHVHDKTATWGHLFANLGYGLSAESLQTDDGVFVDGQGDNKLTFLLNGQKVESVANEVIRSEDVLLVSYGKDDESTLRSRYDGIVKDASEYNSKSDPSTCSGSKPITFTERLKKAIGISAE